MKNFNIEGFNISIEDDIWNEAVEHYILDKGETIEEQKGNYHYLKNLLRASNCQTLEDLKDFSYDNLRKNKTDKEISVNINRMLKREIERH